MVSTPPDNSPTTYQPNKKSIGELLSTVSPHIRVPTWQRSYSWKRENVETFWADLIRFEKSNRSEYFLGSIVIVRTSQDVHLLLDGQQRLVTSAILLAAIREKVRSYRPMTATRIQSRYLSDLDDATEVTTFKLTLNTYDNDFFADCIMTERLPPYKEPAALIASHKLIKNAFDYFTDQLTAEMKDLSPEQGFQRAIAIQKTLTTGFTVISVVSTDEDAAAEVFETLNDRGIGLSTPDLLRNLIMRRANVKNHDAIIKLWEPVFAFEKDTTIKNFLRHFWISNYGDVKSQSLYREIKDTIIDKSISSLSFSKNLKSSAENYGAILECVHEDEYCKNLLIEVSSLGAGARILYPTILAMIELGSIDEQRSGLKSLINMYVRASVIGGKENSLIENTLYLATRNYRNDKDVNKLKESISSASLDDDEFGLAFGKASVKASRTQRYLLTKFEQFNSTEEKLVAGSKKVHVEHIYPQTPLEGENIGKHNDFVNRIGNLTLLSQKLNQSIKNGRYSDKYPEYQKSEINITKFLPAKDEWKETEITERQAGMIEAAKQIWASI